MSKKLKTILRSSAALRTYRPPTVYLLMAKTIQNKARMSLKDNNV